MRVLILIIVLLLINPTESRSKTFSFDPQKWQRVIINEVMLNPKAIEEQFGEWIELYNPYETEINIQGWVLLDEKNDFHIISPYEPLFIEPKGYLVMGKSKKYLGKTLPYIDYEYGEHINLNNYKDNLTLIWGNSMVDTVSYSYDEKNAFKFEGYSMNLEPFFNGISAYEKKWCPAKIAIYEEGDFGTPKEKNTFCDNDGDGEAEDDGDCDDNDPSIYGGGVEVCDGVDNDCDGEIDEDLLPPQICLNKGVCKDAIAVCDGFSGWNCNYGDFYEAEKETLCDGLDNDCNGETDENLLPSIDCLQKGVCSKSKPQCKGKDGWKCSYPPSYEEIEGKCDGLDNDCDGETDEGFEIGKTCKVGKGNCEREGKLICGEDGKTSVCDAIALEGGKEICGDGLDNDCDGETDEGFNVGEECFSGVGECKVKGIFKCSEDGLSTVCSAKPLEPQKEICSNNKDDDCDGEIDEEDCSFEKKGEGRGGCNINKKTSFFPLILLFILFLLCFLPSRKR